MAAKKGMDADDMDVDFNVEDAIEMNTEKRKAYLTKIAGDIECPEIVEEFCTKFLPELEELESYNTKPSE